MKISHRSRLVILLGLALSVLHVGAQSPPLPARAEARRLDPVFDSAAVVAWQQFERLWIPANGLAKATFEYDKLTAWDIGSVLGALYSARVLGFIDDAEYHRRMCLTLETLEQIPLYQDAVFHKIYDANSGSMLGRGGGPSKHGYAWSATDLGRILVWLRIVASDSNHAELAARIANRMNFSRVVADGYIHGEEITPSGRTRRFQEGRIGYEQYAARGFALWGQPVAPALNINTHAAPLSVLDIPLLKDTRGLDRLTSEPFVLLGLEIGWTPDEAALARNLLKVQEARYRRTRLVTIASEDAVGIAPYFFYYYCVYCSGQPFIIETADPGAKFNSPRWISTKATFGWHALLPSEYTALAVQRVGRARASTGWSSGVMERSGTPTRTYDVNTAAVILEAAAYHKLGRPLLTLPSTSAIAP